jgi:hypothetical protein
MQAALAQARYQTEVAAVLEERVVALEPLLLPQRTQQ